jgi:phage terminase large subunit-like protein
MMNDEIFFDAAGVALDIAFIESLVLTKCTLSGGPENFHLLPFQRKLVANLLGWKHVDSGARVYRRCYLSTARKNGKTELTAALALLLLIDPGEMSPEIYAAAKAKDQATFLFAAASDMVANHDELRELLHVVPHKAEIHNPENGGLLKALSSEGRTKHGSNPSAVLIDEFHVWSSGERELYDALVSGTAARKQPLVMFTTTAGIGQETLCFREYSYAKGVQTGETRDASYLSAIYELPKDSDWKDESLWPLANPALGTIAQIGMLRQERDKAIAQSSERQKFKRLHLNMWTDTMNQWIPIDKWNACAKDFDIRDLRDHPCYGGLDLGATRDLTCFALLWPVESKVYVRVWFWIPEHGIQERSRRDGVPYSQWAEEGHIELTAGRDTDWSVAREHIKQLASEFTIEDIGADPYNARDTAHELERAGLTVTAVGQKHPDLNAPTRRFEELVIAGDFIHDGHPILKWNVVNCGISSDAEGRVKPTKLEKEFSKRIDGVSACVVALDRIIRRPSNDEGGSIYEHRGLLGMRMP